MSHEPLAQHPGSRGPGPLRWLAGEPGQREGLAFGLVLALLAALPVMVAAYPQMVDYPAHLARYHVMLERYSSPWLQRYYGFEWRLMGNLGVDLLIRPLAAIMPLEAAGRLVAGLLPVLCGLGIVSVDWALRRRVGLASVLAFVFVWSPSMLLGFLNFVLALALALFAFAGWILLEGKRWRVWLYMPVGLIVWLCHVSGWGVLGLLVFGYEWSRSKSWRAFVAPVPLMLPFFVLAAGATVGGSGGGELVSYGPAPEVYKWAIWRQAMRATLQWVDYSSVIAIGIVLVGSMAFRRFDGRIGWAAVLMLVGSLVMPRHIFGGDYVDARMISSGLLAACLALSWRAPRWVLIAACSLFAVRLGYTAMDWQRDSRETARHLAALDLVPRGARIASVVATDRGTWGFNAQEHICGYAVIRKDALTNCNFVLPGVHMLTLRAASDGFRDPFHRVLRRNGVPLDLSKYGPAREADWLWYVGNGPPAALPAGAVVVRSQRHSLLARLANPPRGS
jgi:hypothetical protein